KPRNVCVELEELVAVAAGHIINPFTAREAAVENRDLRLARRHEAAVDVADTILHVAQPLSRHHAIRLCFQSHACSIRTYTLALSVLQSMCIVTAGQLRFTGMPGRVTLGSVPEA